MNVIKEKFVLHNARQGKEKAENLRVILGKKAQEDFLDGFGILWKKKIFLFSFFTQKFYKLFFQM